MIRYVPHSGIDMAAWDARLERCANKLWYGSSWTLSAAAPGWDALIDDEADAQMALPWRRKFGITYAYQPFLLQQLGPFASRPSPADTARFIAALPGKFRFADIYLCPGTPAPPLLTEQQNITFNLRETIDALRKRYSENHRRTMKRTDAAAAGWDGHVPLSGITAFFIASDQFKRWGIKPDQVRTLIHVLVAAEERGHGFGCGVRWNGTLVCAAFFIRWGGRLIFLKGLANEQGRTLHAMHYLIDRVIADHTGQDLLFDFAGTNDPDLSRFYMGFGGERSVYLRALVNKLPFPLNLLRT
jgi:hypothetical protein